MRRRITGSAAALVAACVLFLGSAPCYVSCSTLMVADKPQEARYHREYNDDIEILPMEKELSPSALETLAYLSLMRAILEEDEDLLLEAAPLMSDAGVPASVWLDGGVWAITRRSETYVPYLELALKAWPDDLSLTLLFADSLGEDGQEERGVQLITDYLARHPASVDASLELALLLVKSSRFDEAQQILDSIPAKDHTFLVDYYQARALMGMDRTSEAIPWLKKALAAKPDFVEGLAELAFAYENEGDLREALKTYERLQQFRFSQNDVALRLIDLAIRLKEPEKALGYIENGPDTIAFRLTAAATLAQAGYYLQAEKLLKEMVETEDVPAEVYLLLADMTWEQRHDLKRALSWLDKIPAGGGRPERIAMLRIQLYAEADKLADATNAANEAVQTFPDVPELRDIQIRLLARGNHLKEALAAAAEATRKWPTNGALAFLYGTLLDEAGEKEQAMQTMEGILKSQPDNFQALNYVGYTLADQNRELERALSLLTRADELAPEQAYIVDSLAWALFRSGKGEDAFREIQRAVKLGDKTDPAIWDHYGDIAISLGKKDEARKAWDTAIGLNPDNVEEIRKKLSAL